RPPAHRVRPARVICRHPPEGARAPAPGIRREEQPVWSEGVLQIGEHEPWFDDGLQIAAIDLEDLAHARERDDDPAARRDGAAGLAGPGAARNDGRAG